ncbi:MAG: cysteine dioxygenase family protein [Cyanobacteria bacterium P01_A01_bin.123]
MIQTTFHPTMLNPVNAYPERLQRLIQTLQQACDFTPGQIREIVLRAQISTEDLMPWANFDHPVADSYGRQLVFHGGHFEIMVMSWMPGDFSAIHDHGATDWGAVQCFGAAEHYIYRFAEGVLSTLKTAHYSPRMVHTVDHNLIHQMGNAGARPFLSLHVYGCEQIGETITGNARIFDLLEGSIQYTNGGVFFSLPEAQINQRLLGLKADRETTLRHHDLMSDRIRRILKTQPNADLAQKLALLQTRAQQLNTYQSRYLT